MLFRYSDAKYFADVLYINRDLRFGSPGDGLDLGLKFIVLTNPDNPPIIPHPDQDDTIRCIAKGAYLSPEVGSARTFELGGEAFSEGNEIGEGDVLGKLSGFFWIAD